MSKRAAIVGAQGYSGLALAQYLLDHPEMTLSAVFARQIDWQLCHDINHAAAITVPTYLVDDLTKHLPELDVIFLATPAAVSIDLAPICLQQHLLVIDISGGFRLSAEQYPNWYGFQHQAADLLPQAHYGLVPWQQKPTSHLIANPGCYATAALMALLPVMSHIAPDSIILDGKSGVTGAGRSAKKQMLFAEVDSDFYPYKIGQHQHTPEISRSIAKLTGQFVMPKLTTQILPISRGIAMTLYARLLPGTDQQQIDQAFQTAYQDYRLVSYASLAQAQKHSPQLLHLKSVVNSAKTHLVYQVDGAYLQVFSFIDNLCKGAASQAIENLNLYFDWPVSLGLLPQEQSV